LYIFFKFVVFICSRPQLMVILSRLIKQKKICVVSPRLVPFPQYSEIENPFHIFTWSDLDVSCSVAAPAPPLPGPPPANHFLIIFRGTSFKTP
jgi:hypothetical protein